MMTTIRSLMHGMLEAGYAVNIGSSWDHKEYTVSGSGHQTAFSTSALTLTEAMVLAAKDKAFTPSPVTGADVDIDVALVLVASHARRDFCKDAAGNGYWVSVQGKPAKLRPGDFDVVIRRMAAAILR
jgi:hypothetical protein